MVQAAVPSTTLCPAQPALALSVPWGFWFLGFKVSPRYGIGVRRPVTACPEKLGSQFSYPYFLDGNLCSPKEDLWEWPPPPQTNGCTPLSVGSCQLILKGASSP